MTSYRDDMFVLEPGVENSENDEGNVVRHEEIVPLFGDQHNPNHDIFVTPTQDGADKDDQWNGSIGDATMEHLFQMRHKMLEMEHFVHMPNGNIFRIEQNVSAPDENGARNLRNQVMNVMTAPDGRQSGRQVNGQPARRVTLHDKERVIEFLKNEIEEAKKAKEEKLDALDQVLVPFDEWESMPQMTGVIDIPATPPPLYIYAGNSNQMFYDYVPEDHPDVKKINSFLAMANAIDWDAFNEKTVEYFKHWIYDREWKHYFAAERLVQLCNEICIEDHVLPSDLAIQALTEIEENWSQVLRVEVIDKFQNEDPILQELNELRSRLENNKKAGKLSWAEIGKFGQFLYKKYGTAMSTLHWHYYRDLKKTFAPEVKIGKININTANMNDLRKFFTNRYQKDIDRLIFDDTVEEKQSEVQMQKIKQTIEKNAQWVFFNRPFMTVEDLATAGVITVDDIGYTNNTVVLVSLVKKAYRESLNFKSSAPLGRIAQQIVNYQRAKPGMCTEQEWFSVWQIYRICKADIYRTLGLK